MTWRTPASKVNRDRGSARVNDSGPTISKAPWRIWLTRAAIVSPLFALILGLLAGLPITEAAIIIFTGTTVLVSIFVLLPLAIYYSVARIILVVRTTRFSLRTLMFFMLFGASCVTLLVTKWGPFSFMYGVTGSLVFVSFFISHLITGNEAYEDTPPPIADAEFERRSENSELQ